MSDSVLGIITPIRLEYTHVPGRASSRFLRAVEQRRLIGQRCGRCGHVYVPPRGSCPTCGIATDEEVTLSDKGTVTTFCVVNLPFYGQSIKPPYVCASILLDGADISLFHLILEIPAEEVRMGLRVRAVLAEDEAMAPTLESITHFRPTGEPDAPFESYRDRL